MLPDSGSYYEGHRVTVHQQLANQVSKQRGLRPNGIAISSLKPLSDRHDNSIDSIFQEGNAFSGITKIGNAEVCLTTTASPHIRPSIPTPRFLAAVEKVLGPDASMPRGLYTQDLLPSQLLMWWRKGGDAPRSEYDFLKMRTPEDVSDFSTAISIEATKAVKIITQFNEPPQIWGSWGFGSRDERAQSGLSRGAPTNGVGHCHFTNFSGEQNIILSSDVPVGEAVNHFSPWGMVVHERFGLDIADVMEQVADDYAPNTPVVPFSEIVGNSSWQWVRNGYLYHFLEPLALKDTIALTANVANFFGEMHQEVMDVFGKYYKSRLNPSVKREMQDLFEYYGFTHISSGNLTEFLTNIKPTRGLLEQWLAEEPTSTFLSNLLERYKKVATYLESDAKKSRTLSRVLMKDTYRDPADLHEPNITLPQHSSGWFLITDYSLRDDEIMVNKLELFANLGTTEAAPQSLLGAILRRVMP